MGKFKIDNLAPAIALVISGILVGMFIQFLTFDVKDDGAKISYREGGSCKTVNREFRYAATVVEGTARLSYEQSQLVHTHVGAPPSRTYDTVKEVVTIECSSYEFRVDKPREEDSRK